MKKLFLSILIILFTLNVVYALDNVNWYSYEDGVALSNKTQKPLLMVVYYQNPPELVFKDVLVINSVNNNYVPIKIDMRTPSGQDILKKIKEKNFLSPPGISQLSITINIMNPEQQYLGVRSYEFEDNWNVNQTELLEFLNQYGQTTNKYDLNKVTIKEFKAFLENLEKQKLVKVNAKLEGATIRDLSGPSGDQYSLTLDDGSSSLHVIYNGSIGDITTGDKVDVDMDVEGLLIENSPIPKIIKIAKSGNLAPQNSISMQTAIATKSDATKTSGFEITLAIVVLILISYFHKKVLSR